MYAISTRFPNYQRNWNNVNSQQPRKAWWPHAHWVFLSVLGGLCVWFFVGGWSAVLLLRSRVVLGACFFLIE